MLIGEMAQYLGDKLENGEFLAPLLIIPSIDKGDVLSIVVQDSTA